ncbi:predicted protein [Sclerotinia sclerotiorum 1980 UF-70]|uniref:Uncharacterized protein n=1 Tax=Sclerotinia sclerotiorum (strain ATCC 18683 / 1980 / Ss-1) TaxID=665079 RepID=A7EWI3_SCLS1|nr:predicted protein [Sclerotinia sclerotiorum 1980 UF-70]EDN93825.1 predicted protein [Sclerotinia sclerotiorum 1980 UF-70]
MSWEELDHKKIDHAGNARSVPAWFCKMETFMRRIYVLCYRMVETIGIRKNLRTNWRMMTAKS